MPHSAGTDGQGDGSRHDAGVVNGPDGHRARLVRAVHDAQEPLPIGMVGAQEERNGQVVAGRRGEIDQVAAAALKQVHDHKGRAGIHDQLPLAGTLAQATGEVFRTRFQVSRGDGARVARRQSQRHLAYRSRSVVVIGCSNGNPSGFAVWVDQAQFAHLVAVAAGVEGHHPMAGACAARCGRHDIVHAGEEAILGADVDERLNVQARLEVQPPIACAIASRPFEPFGRFAVLQICRVEMSRLTSADSQGKRSETLAAVVNGVDGHGAASSAAVDDPGEALLHGVGIGNEERCGSYDSALQRGLQHVGAFFQVPAGHFQVVHASRHLHGDVEIGPVVWIVVVAGHQPAVGRGERAHDIRAAVGVQPQHAGPGDVNAEIVQVQRHLQLAGDHGGQRQDASGVLAVAVVVCRGSGVEGDVQRRGGAALVEAAHCQIIGAAAELADDLEVAARAAVVVGDADCAVGTVECADGVDAAARLHLQQSANGQLEAEVVHVVDAVQYHCGGRRNRHCGRRGQRVAVVVRLACRVERDLQPVGARSVCVWIEAFHLDEVGAGHYVAFNQEVAPGAAVIVLGQHLAGCVAERASGIDTACGLHAQSAGLRQLNAEVVHIVAILVQLRNGDGRRSHRRGFGRGVAVVDMLGAEIGNHQACLFQTAHGVGRTIVALDVAGLRHAQRVAVFVWVADTRRGEVRHPLPAIEAGPHAAVRVGHDGAPTGVLGRIGLKGRDVDVTVAESKKAAALSALLTHPACQCYEAVVGEAHVVAQLVGERHRGEVEGVRVRRHAKGIRSEPKVKALHHIGDAAHIRVARYQTDEIRA